MALPVAVTRDCMHKHAHVRQRRIHALAVAPEPGASLLRRKSSEAHRCLLAPVGLAPASTSWIHWSVIGHDFGSLRF